MFPVCKLEKCWASDWLSLEMGDMSQTVDVRDEMVAHVKGIAKGNAVLWSGIVVAAAGAVAPQVREARNSVHLVHSHDRGEHCVLVLPDEVGGAGGGHVALVIRLAVHAESEHHRVGAVLAVACPGGGWIPLHARRKSTINREESLVWLGLRPLGLLREVPVVIGIPLSLSLVIPLRHIKKFSVSQATALEISPAGRQHRQTKQLGVHTQKSTPSSRKCRCFSVYHVRRLSTV
eukprot:SAG31_NODE_299_length_18114_cov_3.533777_6_plen_233_part_00